MQFRNVLPASGGEHIFGKRQARSEDVRGHVVHVAYQNCAPHRRREAYFLSWLQPVWSIHIQAIRGHIQAMSIPLEDYSDFVDAMSGPSRVGTHRESSQTIGNQIRAIRLVYPLAKPSV